MFQHILVPLDGSGLAESALPLAVGLARALAARLTLIHLIEKGAPGTVHGERHLTRSDEAQAYLAEASRRYVPPGVPVNCHVHGDFTRTVAEGIVLHEGELAPDLVVMCMHGDGGLKGLLFGRVAQQVAGSGRIPVLVARPGAVPEPPPRFDPLLVPLDGDPAHAHGLGTAAALAGVLGAEVVLLSVVPTPGTLRSRQLASSRFLPSATRFALDLTEEDTHRFLQGEAERLKARGLSARTEVRRGEVAQAIADAAAANRAGMVVLGTHGSFGTEAFWRDSVGARVLPLVTCPLLLVPPPGSR